MNGEAVITDGLPYVILYVQDKFLDAAISFMETPLMNAVGSTLDKVRTRLCSNIYLYSPPPSLTPLYYLSTGL